MVAGIPTSYLMGSRGCYGNCSYCCITTLHRLAPGERSEERRGGEGGRSLCDWSSDVCSSDLWWRGYRPAISWGVADATGTARTAALRRSTGWRRGRDRKSVAEGKEGDHCVTGVQTCALPIYGGGDTDQLSHGESRMLRELLVLLHYDAPPAGAGE